jgi:anti-sigma regulatory factor (Ser/Thr protein kinase)
LHAGGDAVAGPIPVPSLWKREKSNCLPERRSPMQQTEARWTTGTGASLSPGPAVYSHRIALGIAGAPEEVGRVRRVVGEWVTRCVGQGDVRDRVLLVVSELVSNAVRHAPGPGIGVAVGLRCGREAVVVEVWDGSVRAPVRGAEAGAQDESGRGLALVEALAVRWGWAAHPGGGKTTWALVPVTAALPVCGQAARLPAYLVAGALGFAPGTGAGEADVERDLRCTREAHTGGEHHAHVMDLPGRDTGAVWGRWGHPGGQVRLAVLPDCPATAPAPADGGCCEYAGHPGGHSYELAGP